MGHGGAISYGCVFNGINGNTRQLRLHIGAVLVYSDLTVFDGHDFASSHLSRSPIHEVNCPSRVGLIPRRVARLRAVVRFTHTDDRHLEVWAS